MISESRPRLAIVTALIALLAGGIIAFALIGTGTVMFHHADRVPCNSLTSYAQVQTVVNDKADIITRITNSGAQVTVTPVKAECPDSRDQLGYIRITYTTDSERDAIQSILDHEPLGVFITLDKA